MELGEKREQNDKKFIDTDNGMVITQGKGCWGKVEERKGGINGDGRRLDSGW